MRVALFVLLLVMFVCSVFRPASAAVVLEPLSVSFPFVPALFAPAITNSEKTCGVLHVADPLDGCAGLRNRFEFNATQKPSFVVIARGGCDFDVKIRHAQDAGYHAAIVYNYQLDGDLITMGGNFQGIKIHAVSVSKVAGEFLKLYAQVQERTCCITPHSHFARSWTELEVALMVLLCVFTLLFIVLLLIIISQHLSHGRENFDSTTTVEPSPSPRLTVVTLPTFTFQSREACAICLDEGETFAICLEDYKEGETFSALPCNHSKWL